MPAVSFGTMVPPLLSPGQQVQMAGFLESMGFEHLWWPDHLLFTDEETAYDCWTIMAASALRTRRVTLGTAVSDPHRLHPAVFAQRAATLDQLSKGRVIVGLGSGESMNLDPFGIEWQTRRVGRLREFLRIFRGLLAGQEPLDLKGDFHQARRAVLTALPYRGRQIPVYMAALGPQMQRLCGQLADGWLPTLLPARYWREYFEPVAAAAREAGRAPTTIAQSATVVVALLDQGQTLTPQQIARGARRFAGSMIWPVVAKRLGVPFEVPPHLEGMSYHTVNPCDPESLARYREYCEWVPDELLPKFLLVGTVSDIRAGLAEYIEAGVTSLTLLNVSPDPIWSTTTLATRVIPYFHGRGSPLAAKFFHIAVAPLKRLGLTRRTVPSHLDIWKELGV